ncbi:unnamed protein product [Paramecium pentaurelia]|uniref:Protein kinase domain-containing protein n=1 Tax=Paramecium pentaurelia TaxID=43138 RepID=A0A8S1VH22_9CILI|nr:unnamed protein product [Paramecium pentaurelia]
MSLFQCPALFLTKDSQFQDVIITTQFGSLQIELKNGNEQLVYLPQTSMDTILCFARKIDENKQMGTLDLHNPETQIKVTFLLSLQNIEQLSLRLKGRQIFYSSSNYIVLEKLAPGVKLISTLQRVSVEKKAIFLSKDQLTNSRLGQLKQEADILRLLKDNTHKNIIQLEEILTDYKSVSIILEYCRGGDLLKLLHLKRSMIDIPVLMFNLLSGLRHLHDLEIVHRDIKLQNILFTDSQRMDSLKISDFGFACKKSEIQYINPRCGTLGYTAPEVFSQPCSYDEKVDIYSAGIVFYNLLTFKNPFGNLENISDLIKFNINGDYNETHLENTKLNNPLAYNLLISMLQKESNKRPSAYECLNHPYLQSHQQGDFIKEMIQIKRKLKKKKKINLTIKKELAVYE